VWMARMAPHVALVALTLGRARFKVCFTASKAHLGISFNSRLSRSKIPRIALGIEKVQKR